MTSSIVKAWRTSGELFTTPELTIQGADSLIIIDVDMTNADSALVALAWTSGKLYDLLIYCPFEVPAFNSKRQIKIPLGLFAAFAH